MPSSDCCSQAYASYAFASSPRRPCRPTSGGGARLLSFAVLLLILVVCVLARPSAAIVYEATVVFDLQSATAAKNVPSFPLPCLASSSPGTGTASGATKVCCQEFQDSTSCGAAVSSSDGSAGSSPAAGGKSSDHIHVQFGAEQTERLQQLEEADPHDTEQPTPWGMSPPPPPRADAQAATEFSSAPGAAQTTTGGAMKAFTATLMAPMEGLTQYYYVITDDVFLLDEGGTISVSLANNGVALSTVKYKSYVDGYLLPQEARGGPVNSNSNGNGSGNPTGDDIVFFAYNQPRLSCLYNAHPLTDRLCYPNASICPASGPGTSGLPCTAFMPNNTTRMSTPPTSQLLTTNFMQMEADLQVMVFDADTWYRITAGARTEEDRFFASSPVELGDDSDGGLDEFFFTSSSGEDVEQDHTDPARRNRMESVAALIGSQWPFRALSSYSSSRDATQQLPSKSPRPNQPAGIFNLNRNPSMICSAPAIYNLPLRRLIDGSGAGGSMNITHQYLPTRVVVVLAQCSAVPLTISLAVTLANQNGQTGSAQYYMSSVMYFVFMVAYAIIFVIFLLMVVRCERHEDRAAAARERKERAGGREEGGGEHTSDNNNDDDARGSNDGHISARRNNSSVSSNSSNGRSSSDRRRRDRSRRRRLSNSRSSSGSSSRRSHSRYGRDADDNFTGGYDDDDDDDDGHSSGSYSSSGGDGTTSSTSSGDSHSAAGGDCMEGCAARFKSCFRAIAELVSRVTRAVRAWWAASHIDIMFPSLQWILVSLMPLKILIMVLRAAEFSLLSGLEVVQTSVALSAISVVLTVCASTLTFVLEVLVGLGWGLAYWKLSTGQIIVLSFACCLGFSIYVAASTCPQTGWSTTFTHNSYALAQTGSRCKTISYLQLAVEIVFHLFNATMMLFVTRRLSSIVGAFVTGSAPPLSEAELSYFYVLHPKHPKNVSSHSTQRATGDDGGGDADSDAEGSSRSAGDRSNRRRRGSTASSSSATSTRTAASSSSSRRSRRGDSNGSRHAHTHRGLTSPSAGSAAGARKNQREKVQMRLMALYLRYRGMWIPFAFIALWPILFLIFSLTFFQVEDYYMEIFFDELTHLYLFCFVLLFMRHDSFYC